MQGPAGPQGVAGNTGPPGATGAAGIDTSPLYLYDENDIKIGEILPASDNDNLGYSGTHWLKSLTQNEYRLVLSKSIGQGAPLSYSGPTVTTNVVGRFDFESSDCSGQMLINGGGGMEILMPYKGDYFFSYYDSQLQGYEIKVTSELSIYKSRNSYLRCGLGTGNCAEISDFSCIVSTTSGSWYDVELVSRVVPTLLGGRGSYVGR